MARNTDKYVYLTIALLKNGETHQAIKQDAEENGTSQLPTIASVRLGDYYKLKRQGQLHTLSSREETQQAISQLPHDFTEELAANVEDADEAWPE